MSSAPASNTSIARSLDADRRREQLAGERAGLDLTALADAFAGIQSQHDAQKASLDGVNAELETRKHALTELQDQQRTAQAELAEVRKQAQTARGRLSSLETLQHAALGQEQGAATDWLKARGLDSAARVGEKLEVEAGWENAVESALGQLIEGVLVEAPEALVDALGELGEGRLALVVAAERRASAFAPTSLASKVQGPIAIRRMLSKLHAAETLADARAMLPQLGDGESVITRQGEWLGAGWVRVAALRRGQAGRAAARARDPVAAREIEQLQHREAELERGISAWRDRLLDAEQQREDAQRALYLAHRGVSELAGQLQSQQGRLETARSRIERIDAELAQLVATLDGSREQAREARARLDDAVARMARARKRAPGARCRTPQPGRSPRRGPRRSARIARHCARAGADRSNRNARADAGPDPGAGAHGQPARPARLAPGRTGRAAVAEGDAPVNALEGERQAALDQRVLDRKGPGRGALRAGWHRQRTARVRTDPPPARRAGAGPARGDRRSASSTSRRWCSRPSSCRRPSSTPASCWTTSWPALPDDADVSAWEKAVADIDAKLRRLEPVNLAAIQEYAEQAQRKEYLDAQDADLTPALETLEDAIRKIDRETRGRFKETFDRVNAGVQELYPRLFGGGHAYLELTGEDLLDTGVSIMARPPGKRVSNISLLSGGEKAMTAVALVFAIFRLNPAPFCLLDEVDAPLDEANVGRFTAMVSEMSEAVQFLFVTHNKATMEAAHQLSGVTMREPGVSRLVSVDLAEAARLAGAA